MGLFSRVFGMAFSEDEDTDNTELVQVSLGNRDEIQDEILDEDAYLELGESANFAWRYGAVALFREQQREKQLKRYLIDNNILVFPEDKVSAYMDRITPNGFQWFWFATSPAMGNEPDRKKMINFEVMDFNGRQHDGLFIGASGKMLACNTYRKPIPIPVLMRMAEIREQFSECRFWVTDIVKVDKPDPFLMVTLGSERFIIERWNEPSFRI